MKNLFLAAACASFIGFTSCSTMKNQKENTSVTKTSTFVPGVYKGNIPSGNSKQNVEITFKDDNTFALSETFPGSTTPMSSTGTWKYYKDTNKVILKYSNIADRVTTFSIVNDKTIQMHSGSAWTKETAGTEYNLVRQ
ncbi:copper resistance protein NlpE N-terminal domain-containing protein [Chryseobacterium sp. LAM-KRS1]|uniref:copper resistance protein NlpE N-terminal domain-containing protein n=1 Tax=Chryseobacterium sp. LAM-KRS1 TaxID=2715754 RepID=UPI0015570BDD|nr:copper resistance protein NlpE N-terminal domain-containing protein [Chryseobacterium sp. LAM-KRS1]